MKNIQTLSLLLLFSISAVNAQKTIEREIIYDIEAVKEEGQFLNLDEVGGLNGFINRLLINATDQNYPCYIINDNWNDTATNYKFVAERIIDTNQMVRIPSGLLNYHLNEENFIEYFNPKDGNSYYISKLKQLPLTNWDLSILKSYKETMYSDIDIETYQVVNGDCLLIDNYDTVPEYKTDTINPKKLSFNYKIIAFHEKWIYNPTDYSMKKKVLGLVIKSEKGKMLLYIPINDGVNSQEDLISSQTIYNVKVNNKYQGMYHHIDSVFRYILYDTYFKLEDTLLEVEFLSEKYSFGNCLYDITEFGEVYEYKDDDGKIVYNKDGSVKLVYEPDKIKYSKGTKFGFVESWYFNWEKFEMKKVVKGYFSGDCYYPFNP